MRCEVDYEQRTVSAVRSMGPHLGMLGRVLETSRIGKGGMTDTSKITVSDIALACRNWINRIADLERDLAAVRKERDELAAAVIEATQSSNWECDDDERHDVVCVWGNREQLEARAKAILTAHDAAKDAEILRLSLAITTAIKAEPLQDGRVTYVAKLRADVESAGVMAFQQAQELVDRHDQTLVEPLVEALTQARTSLAEHRCGTGSCHCCRSMGMIDAALAPYRTDCAGGKKE